MGTLALAGFLLTPEEWADEELRELVVETYGADALATLERELARAAPPARDAEPTGAAA